MTFSGTSRPPARWFHAQTELDDFVMVTYRVDSARLREVVPPPFEPTEFTFDDGSVGGLVSAVVFSDRDFRFRFAPFFPVSCGQINYRTYVDYRTYGSSNAETGVWFFGTSLDSAFVHLPRLAWGMPWHRTRVQLVGLWDGERAERIALSAQGPWGTAALDLVGTDQVAGRLDGFADRDETVRVLTHPMVGWYARRSGGIGRYSVWHDVLHLSVCNVQHCRFSVFEDLGLVTPDAEPHSVLAQRTVHFDVHTPPTRLPQW